VRWGTFLGIRETFEKVSERPVVKVFME